MRHTTQECPTYKREQAQGLVRIQTDTDKGLWVRAWHGGCNSEGYHGHNQGDNVRHIITQTDYCYACGKRLQIGSYGCEVRIVGEDTIVWVGPECAKHIERAGQYQPSKGGPRLEKV